MWPPALCLGPLASTSGQIAAYSIGKPALRSTGLRPAGRPGLPGPGPLGARRQIASSPVRDTHPPKMGLSGASREGFAVWPAILSRRLSRGKKVCAGCQEGKQVWTSGTGGTVPTGWASWPACTFGALCPPVPRGALEGGPASWWPETLGS